MSPTWLAIPLLLTLHSVAAVADETRPDGAQHVLAQQITALLSHKTVALPAFEPGGEPRSEVVPLASPDGRPLNETTASFEGCVLVVRFRHLIPVPAPAGARQIDDRVDISLIDTAPESIEIISPSDTGQPHMPGTVKYEWRPDVQRRMEKLQRLAEEIEEEAVTKFPAEVETRLRWIAGQYEEKLTDKIYLNSGQRTYFANGAEISEPLPWSPRFQLEGEHAAAFVELLHRYQASYCGEQLPV